MKFARRNFLHLAVGAAALPAVSRDARAQAYPLRPVRLIVGFSPGGVTDIVARLMGQWLSTRLSQPFITENRSGAGGNIATEAVVRAPANGYTLLLATSQDAVNATLYERLSFNFIRDISPVASIIRQPNVMLVNASFPAKTLPEFIAYAKANPGKVNMASAGIGNPSHMAGELLKMMTGIDMVHVPYRGGAPALTDLLEWTGASLFRRARFVDRVHQGQQAARARGNVGEPLSGAAEPADLAEFVPGYETPLARSWSAKEHAR
jgi:tripartite-type tricarboxylate transporter receptor subunit TctC